MAEEHEDWEVSREAQPRPNGYSFDLDAALSSMVMLEASVPADAFTADVLGVRRAGNGVVIGEEGVVLTVAYLVTEAQEVQITTRTGRTVPGHVLSADQATGLALIQALAPLDLPPLPLGASRPAPAGEPGGRDLDRRLNNPPRLPTPTRSEPASDRS